jgi:hypothetical protein
VGYLSATIPNGISELTFQYRGQYKLPGPADTYKYRLAVLAAGDTLAVLDKILEGANPYGCFIADAALPPGGELKFVSLGTDALRLDNIQWKDHAGPTANGVRASCGRAPRAQRIVYRNGVLSVDTRSAARITITTIGGRIVSRLTLTGGAAAGQPLVPGAYIVSMSDRGSAAFPLLVR